MGNACGSSAGVSVASAADEDEERRPKKRKEASKPVANTVKSSSKGSVIDVAPVSKLPTTTVATPLTPSDTPAFPSTNTWCISLIFSESCCNLTYFAELTAQGLIHLSPRFLDTSAPIQPITI